MSSPLLTARLQLTDAHYIGDLVSLFRRHRLDCGSRSCLEDLGPQLENNPALRGDLFNLCTAISHMRESDLSPEQLLALVATAVSGELFAAGELEVPAGTRHTFLDLYEQWSNRNWDAISVSDHLTDLRTLVDSGTNPDLPGERFAGPGALAGLSHLGTASLHSEHAQAAARSVTPEMRLGDLTLSELKVYLNEVESRVVRLRPDLTTAEIKVESSTAAGWVPEVHPSAEHPRAHAPECASAGQSGAEPQFLAGATYTAHQAVEAPTVARASGEPSEDPEYSRRPVLLPAQSAPAEWESTTLFGSVSDSPKSDSRSLRWLSAALVLVGSIAGYGYRYVHRVPPVTLPITLPSGGRSATQPASDLLPRPKKTPTAPADTKLDPSARVHATAQRSGRGVGSVPRLPPREVRMEAEAARAEASDRAGAPSSGAEQQATPRQNPAAPVMPHRAGDARTLSPATTSDPHQ